MGVVLVSVEKSPSLPTGQVGCTEGGGLGWKLSSRTPSPLASEISALALWAWLWASGGAVCATLVSHSPSQSPSCSPVL